MSSDYKKVDSDYDFRHAPVACLAILTAEVHELSPPVQPDQLSDFFYGLQIAARTRGLSLAQIGQANLDKLATRRRKPHTIDHLQNNQPSLLEQKRGLWLEAQLEKIC